MLRLTVVLLLIAGGAISAAARPQSKTYPETRKLLLGMERSSSNKAFIKLFEEGDARRSDLIEALYDPEQKVSLNAQSIIKYLAEPEALTALDEWYQYRKGHAKEYWVSPVKLLPEARFLSGDDGDLAKFVLKNLHPTEADPKVDSSTGLSAEPLFSARVVARNKNRNTVLGEIVEGNVFTDGWHAVIRLEDGKWRLLSHYLVWQS